jgi:hypothetical protein
MKPFEYKPIHNPCTLLQDTQICDGGQLAIHLEPLAGHGKRLISVRAVLSLSPSRASMYGNRHVRYLTKFDDVACHIFSILLQRIFGISNGKSGNSMKLIKSYIHGCQRTFRGIPRLEEGVSKNQFGQKCLSQSSLQSYLTRHECRRRCKDSRYPTNFPRDTEFSYCFPILKDAVPPVKLFNLCHSRVTNVITKL